MPNLTVYGIMSKEKSVSETDLKLYDNCHSFKFMIPNEHSSLKFIYIKSLQKWNAHKLSPIPQLMKNGLYVCYDRRNKLECYKSPQSCPGSLHVSKHSLTSDSDSD